MADELWKRVRSCLPGPARGWPKLPGLRRAAVLVPLMRRQGQASLVLIERAAQLRHHGGQIAFPGGAVEPQDASNTDTAVRETCEELGTARADIEVLGNLPEVPTLSGFHVAPIVARLAADRVFQPCPEEVAAVVEVPLEALLPQRTGFLVPAYRWQEQRIWGVTAWILRGFLKRLRKVL